MKLLNVQLWRGSYHVNRSKRMHGSEWVFGFAMLKWSVVYQFGTEIPLSLRLLRRFLGWKLRIGSRRSNTEAEHGRSRSYPCLSSNHFKWALSLSLSPIYSFSAHPSQNLLKYIHKWLELYHTLNNTPTHTHILYYVQFYQRLILEWLWRSIR